MSTSFCVRCKRKTPTNGAHRATTKTGKECIKGTCANCGCKKCQFIKTGSGIKRRSKMKGRGAMSDWFKSSF